MLGHHGRGLVEALGVEDEVDFITGTFSKSVGTIGGFYVSNYPEMEALRFASRAYMFTASQPPSVIASAAHTLQTIHNSHALRETLWDNVCYFYDGLQALGFTLGSDKTPVIPVYMPDVETGIAAWNYLIQNGVYGNLAMPPATPNKLCLLRCSISAAHSKADLDRALQGFAGLAGQLHGIGAVTASESPLAAMSATVAARPPATDNDAETALVSL